VLRALSFLLTVLFHPMLMATYGCVLLLFGLKNSVYDFLTPYQVKWRITLLVFMMSFLLPILNIYLLYKLRRIPSFLLSERSERGFPYLITSLFYFGLVYLLLEVNIWNTLKLFLFGGGIAIVLTALINSRYKISAHMVGLGGLLGVLISVSFLLKLDLTPLYIVVVLVSGAVASARMYLGEHRYGELLLGFVLGILVQSTLFFTLRQISFHYIL
jgi:hypothetical protein